MESRAFIVGLIVGILATVTMDVVAVIALRLGIAGRLGRDAPGDAHLARISLFNHIIFGFGIGLWMAVIRQF